MFFFFISWHKFTFIFHSTLSASSKEAINMCKILEIDRKKRMSQFNIKTLWFYVSVQCGGVSVPYYHHYWIDWQNKPNYRVPILNVTKVDRKKKKWKNETSSTNGLISNIRRWIEKSILSTQKEESRYNTWSIILYMDMNGG